MTIASNIFITFTVNKAYPFYKIAFDIEIFKPKAKVLHKASLAQQSPMPSNFNLKALKEKIDHEPEPTRVGDDNQASRWVISSQANIQVEEQEWVQAKSIMDRCLKAGIRAPFKITRDQWSQEYPELYHSFVCVEKNDQPQLAAIAQSEPYEKQGKTITEGVIGFGKKGLVKEILFETGEVGAVKIKAPTNDQEAKALEQLDRLDGQIITHRAQASSWIPGRDGQSRTIKDFEYLVTNRCEGQSLKKYLKKSKLDFNAQKMLAIKVLTKVQAMHDKGVIHGDLSPGNIMIDQQGEIQLIDFGAAQILQPNQTEVVTGKAKGSRRFMAPEIGQWKGGEWKKSDGIYSRKSDLYAVGMLLKQAFKKDGMHPKFEQVLNTLTCEDRTQRSSSEDVLTHLKNLDDAPLKPITSGQALLMMIAKESQSQDEYKKLYLNGFKSKEDNEVFKRLQSQCQAMGYIIDDSARAQANDPTRRYFETHLGLETMKSRSDQVSLEMLQNYYEQVKASFETLGGDLDLQAWKEDQSRVLQRDYEQEQKRREASGLNPADLIKGISSKEQATLDRCFRGEIRPNDNDMFKEYAHLITQIQSHDQLSDEQKEKISLIIKSTRLSMVLGNKITKYKKLGIYQGEPLPLGEVYSSGIYLPENRGRVTKDNHAVVGHHHMGLLKPHHPLPINDEAFSAKPIDYYKPSDRSDFTEEAMWSQEWKAQKVHTFSNSISGTMLVQLRQMVKQKQDGRLPFTTCEDLRNYLSLMMSSMTYISGGHSLNEFSSPVQLPQIKQAFSDLSGFEELDLESFFAQDNEQALNSALTKTISYHQSLQKKSRVHDELLDKVKQPVKANSDIVTHEEAMPYVPKIKPKGLAWHNQLNKTIKKERLNLEHYSFMPHSLQNEQTLLMISKATGESIINGVAFKPERALLHAASAHVTANIHHDSTQRDELVMEATKALSAQVTEHTQGWYEQLKNQAHQQLCIAQSQHLVLDSESEAALAQAKRFVKDNPKSNIKAEELASEILGVRRYKAKLNDYLSKKVGQYFKSHGYALKESSIPSIQRFVAGGSASGKSYKTEHYLNEMQKQGVDRQDIVLLNNDSFKPLLSRNSMPQRLMSQLTHDEARIIRDQAFQWANDASRHMVLDQCSLSTSATNGALKQGKSFVGTIVNTSAENALKRGMRRGYQTNRFEATKIILQTHKNMPKQLLAYLKRFSGKKVELSIEDNNASCAENFMSINLSSKKVKITNMDCVKEFVKKQFINEKSRDYNTLYSGLSDAHLEQAMTSFFADLESMGYQVEKPRLKNRAKIG